MTSDTLREQLGEIVAVLINPISSQAFLDVDYRKLKDEAIEQLEVLCQEIAREARLDELNRLHRYEGKDLPLRDYDNVSDELIDERIAELTHKPETTDDYEIIHKGA